MRVHSLPTIEELISAAANFFIGVGRQAIEQRGEFNVTLAGGTSPVKLYELLSSAGFRDRIDWRKVHFFFGDERHVPADDPRSNCLMARKSLFEPLGIPASGIFCVDVTLPPARAAVEYEKDISAHFGQLEIRFDLTLLGLGTDAHTASLFPSSPLLREKSATVKATDRNIANVPRITMTAPMINRSRQIAFLVFGMAKRDAVRQVLYGEKNPAKYPAQLIQPIDGEVHWFLDRDATPGIRA